jgi:hypothetical protein
VIQADVTQALALGLPGAPSLFVNGRHLRSLPSSEQLRALALAQH